MNGFFRAFTQQEIDTMKRDNSLIDQWVWGGEKYSSSTDVDTAWDVLAQALANAGFQVNEKVDNVLSQGCFFISSEVVRDQAKRLSKWTHEQVLESVKNLDEGSEIYHLEVYQDDDSQDMLLEQFDKLVAFYKEAAECKLGAVFYLA